MAYGGTDDGLWWLERWPMVARTMAYGGLCWLERWHMVARTVAYGGTGDGLWWHAQYGRWAYAGRPTWPWPCLQRFFGHGHLFRLPNADDHGPLFNLYV
jgi:hypothetical protein